MVTIRRVKTSANYTFCTINEKVKQNVLKVERTASNVLEASSKCAEAIFKSFLVT